ncbi:hypothetical protein C2G38_2031926 [Gigaspora rosea]|uniref:TLDc domain-containing protein n=1 Tax=Gigaspora rosea TaxID=44941 RepID=A0A397VRD2_9GLOM|nr:hypothetical protein C2G38_2031926 [Gigaspora rosea]
MGSCTKSRLIIKWTRKLDCENFLALKTTLQNCLPHIRYFQISIDDIVDNIEPYQTIIGRDLWKDIMKRITNPNREISSIILPPRMEPFSAVINEEHAAEIASWIDKKAKPYSIKNNPYSFKLLLRGTRDGFTAATFWKFVTSKKIL